MICFKCEHEESEDFKFCPECGSSQTCYCGKIIKPSSKFCMECGTKVEDLKASPMAQPTQQIIRQPIQQLVQQPIQQFVKKEKKVIITDDSGINIKLKGIFNIITTSMFFFIFVFVFISLFITLDQVLVFGEWDVYFINLNMFTFWFRSIQFDLGALLYFQGLFYLGSAITIIIFIILGTIKGIQSFKDNNNKIAEYTVAITTLLLVPLLITNVHFGGFLRFTVIISFIFIFTRIFFNIILNRKNFTSSQFIAHIFNMSAILLLIISVSFLFRRNFNVYNYWSWTPSHWFSGSVFDLLNIFRAFYVMGDWQTQDLYREIYSRFFIISLVSVAIIVFLGYILQITLVKAVKLKTTSINKNVIFFSVAFFLVIILWVLNSWGAVTWYLGDNWNSFWPEFSFHLTLNNFSGFLLALFALGFSITSTIIISSSKKEPLTSNYYVKEEEQRNFVKEQVLTPKLLINKVTGILTFVSIGLPILIFTFSLFMSGSSYSSGTFAILWILLLITSLLEIALIVLYIVSLIKSKKNNISILGHIFGIISIGLYLLPGLIFIIALTNFSFALMWFAFIMIFIAFILSILAGIFVLIAKPKRSYQQEIQPQYQQLHSE